jgi:hypothetical protein
MEGKKMKFTIEDKKTVIHNILNNIQNVYQRVQNVYQRDSKVYQETHKGLMKLGKSELDCLYTLTLVSRKSQVRS